MKKKKSINFKFNKVFFPLIPHHNKIPDTYLVFQLSIIWLGFLIEMWNVIEFIVFATFFFRSFTFSVVHTVHFQWYSRFVSSINLIEFFNCINYDLCMLLCVKCISTLIFACLSLCLHNRCKTISIFSTIEMRTKQKFNFVRNFYESAHYSIRSILRRCLFCSETSKKNYLTEYRYHDDEYDHSREFVCFAYVTFSFSVYRA